MNNLIIKRGIILICSYIAVAILGNLIVGGVEKLRSNQRQRLAESWHKISDEVIASKYRSPESDPAYLKALNLLNEHDKRGYSFYNSVESYNRVAYKLGAIIFLCYVVAAIVWKQKLGSSNRLDKDHTD
jgi:hypothetical protein